MKIERKGDSATATSSRMRVEVTALKCGDACVDYFAAKGRGWSLIAASERDTAAPLDRTKSWGMTFRAKGRIAPLAESLKDIEKNGDTAVITLGGGNGDVSFEKKITLRDGERFANVRCEITLAKPAGVQRTGASFVFIPEGRLFSQYEPLDQIWIPTLRRDPDHVIADQIFRSPAVTLQTGGSVLALVPDLDVLADHRRMQTVLDARFDAPGLNAPAVWYGFCPNKLDGHVFFKMKSPLISTVKDTLVIAMDVVAEAEAKPHSGRGIAAEHLWNRYGKKNFASIEPQTLDYNELSKRAFSFAVDRGDIWRDVDTGGAPAGGTIALSFSGKKPPRLLKTREIKSAIAASKYLPAVHGFAVDKLLGTEEVNDAFEFLLKKVPQSVMPMVLFQGWFNNLRTGYGMMASARINGDERLADRATKIKELALSAPVEKGFMSSVCYCPEDGPVFWMNGTKAFQSVREYHLPDNAWTGWWMLRWHEELEKDERLLERATALGDAFCAAQRESGAIPGWARVRRGEIISSSILLESAQTAAPGMFLARLAAATGKKKYLAVAKKAADFMIDNVFPFDRWWDFETFFSCSKKDFGMMDFGTGAECMNNLCVFWTAEMFRELADATGEKKHLEHGIRALELLLMWQQVWDAPYLSINTFGGFGVMNTDAEWNDARQSMFAESLAAWYELTGKAEYFERAVAALRASFTTMLVPENESVAQGNMGAYHERIEGATYENYAHMGYDRRAQGYIMFDWGSGGACASAARFAALYGDVYVDAKRGDAFGVNMAMVESAEFGEKKISLALNRKTPGSYVIKFTGIESGKREVRVNGKNLGTFSAAQLSEGIEAPGEPMI